MEQNLHIDKYDSNLIESKIHYIRQLQVIIDSDLAELYDVSTKALNQAVKRNIDRFPSEFMFQLNNQEFESLRSQIVTSNQKGGRRYLPYIDEEYTYHIGASIKDLGKKWFAFSKMDNKVINIIEKINDYLKNINEDKI